MGVLAVGSLTAPWATTEPKEEEMFGNIYIATLY